MLLLKQVSPHCPETRPSPSTTSAGGVFASITHVTEPLGVILSGNHRETLSFLVIDSPLSPIVLGQTWLKRHNPRIDWSTNTITGWSSFCHSTCLTSAQPPAEGAAVPSEPPDLANVPSEYHDLSEVFSKQQATSLPPHRPYDCSIDLLPGAPLPSGRLFNMSLPERGSMETYLRDSLRAGLIRPSSSPVGAGFFFVSKKDGGLRPCIDYRGLNNITIKRFI